MSIEQSSAMKDIDHRSGKDRRKGGDRRKSSRPYNGPERRSDEDRRKEERRKGYISELREKFHEAMINLCTSAMQACNCQPISLQTVVHLGGVQAAKRLLANHVMQSGLFPLSEYGKWDLTVESLVLKEEYRELFEPRELSEAKKRFDLSNGPS